jgi:hypothetical protein
VHPDTSLSFAVRTSCLISATLVCDILLYELPAVVLYEFFFSLARTLAKPSCTRERMRGLPVQWSGFEVDVPDAALHKTVNLTNAKVSVSSK